MSNYIIYPTQNRHKALLCFVSLWLYRHFLVGAVDLFAHILEGCFTDIGVNHTIALVSLKYRQTSNISHTLAVNKVIENSDVGAAPTTSSLPT